MSTATLNRFEMIETDEAHGRAVLPASQRKSGATEKLQGFGDLELSDNGLGGSLGTTGATLKNGKWHNALGLESTEQHRHVSKIWQESGCRPLGEFVDGVENARKLKSDVTVDESAVRLNANLGVVDGSYLTAHALNQLGKLGNVAQGVTGHFIDRATEYAEKALVAEDAAKEAQDAGDYEESRLLAARAAELRGKSAAARAKLASEINDGLNEREIDWAVRTRKDGSTVAREPRSFLIRSRTNGDQRIARAVLSERYGVLDNHEALGMIVNCFPPSSLRNGDLLASHYEDDGDNIFLHLLVADALKDNPDSRRGVGFVVKNSEVGAGSFSFFGFVFDAICLNGTIWGKQSSNVKVDQRHHGDLASRMEAIQEQVVEAARHSLSEGRDLLKAMGYARNIPLVATETSDERTKLIIALSRRNELSVNKARAWAQGVNEMVALEKAHAKINGTPLKRNQLMSVGTLVDGLTRGAQQYSGDDRIIMEQVAGKILTPKLDASEKDMAEFWSKHRKMAQTEATERLVNQYQLVALGR